jgi:hypothetical protein
MFHLHIVSSLWIIFLYKKQFELPVFVFNNKVQSCLNSVGRGLNSVDTICLSDLLLNIGGIAFWTKLLEIEISTWINVKWPYLHLCPSGQSSGTVSTWSPPARGIWHATESTTGQGKQQHALSHAFWSLHCHIVLTIPLHTYGVCLCK